MPWLQRRFGEGSDAQGRGQFGAVGEGHLLLRVVRVEAVPGAAAAEDANGATMVLVAPRDDARLDGLLPAAASEEDHRDGAEHDP